MTNPVSELFDRLADRYDQVIPFFAAFADQMIDVLDPAEGTRLLDIGCGRGAIALAAHLREAGFVDVRSVPLEVHLPMASPEECWDFHLSHGFAGVVEALDAADADEFHRRALDELARMREAGGIILDRGAVLHLATAPTPAPPFAAEPAADPDPIPED